MRRSAFWLAAASIGVLATAAHAQTAAAPPPEDEDTTTVEAVVVTAAPYRIDADELLSSVDVVDRDELDVAPAQGLGDLLTSVPGLRSTFFGPGASRPVIRGLAGPRVSVLTNGVGQVDASALSPDHQVASDPAEATSVEVLRGPSTLLYGGSAIGGVVNIIDERIPTTPARDGLDGRLSLQASSVDEGRQASGMIKAGRGPWVFTVDGLYRESDDYAVPVAPESRQLAALEGEDPEPGDRVPNSAVELTAYGAGLAYVTDAGFIGASVKRTDTTYGVPGHAHAEDGEAAEAVAIDLQQTRYDVRGELDRPMGPFAKLRGSLGYADYQHVELEGAEVGTRFESSGAEGRFELVQAERGGWSGAVGVQGLARSLSAEGEEAYVPSTDVREAGVFTLQRVDHGRWGFEGGLRFDRRALESDVGERAFNNVSASAGLFGRPTTRTFIGFSVSRNERAPTEAELFAFGPHAATRGFEVGDADLGSEVSYGFEGTAHYDHGPIDADLHLFGTLYEGFIDLRPTGAEEDGLAVFAYRQTNAEFYGFEAEAAVDLWRDGDRAVKLETAFDYVRGSTDLGAPARIPPWSATGRLVYAGPEIETRLEARRVAEQDRLADFELPTDGYTLVSLFVAWKPAQLNGATLFAEGRNLFDAEAREHASFLKDLAPLPGRNLRAGVAYRF